MQAPGEYTNKIISDMPADLSSEQARYFKQTIQRFPEEAIYIYSFKENRLLYADGWEEILGYKDDEISLSTIVNSTSSEYAQFSMELNDKALKFIFKKSENLEKYSFQIELKKIHKNGTPIPLIVKVGVFRAENGQLTEMIGRNQVNHSITLGTIMRYAAYGPDISEFEDELNKELFRHYAISEKEKQALALVAKGFAFKEIAAHVNISQSAVEKRILPLYKRFGVKSLSHLITFAYDNHILP
ncbi:LuxR C-terminal-related transcriptional regulator [Spirosoma sp. KNUC1025]|uniref:LuxR C-terminal-related transcriptional regulator n=1 Tax=Spirosoma sp. KNUC1025 TaxID=2894082 RepID=UPI003867C7F3|nr:LuxR C-terminal-related transcriptional regulator [Spirosoma sp. KNUC1025]